MTWAISNEINPLPKEAKQVFQGEIFSVWQWEQELYDGSTATFEKVKRNDTVHTVGVLADGRLLLTEDAQPDREPVITPPGGFVDDGETPEIAARREFLEETGYEVGELVPWHSYQPSNKVIWQVHAFIGRNLKKVAEPQPEAGERIEPLFFTFEEFLQLGHDPKLRDTAIKIILLQAMLDPRKKEELQKQIYG